MDHYKRLSIDRKASQKEIRSAYRKQARHLHPDTGNEEDSSKFREVQEAYDTLSDLESRRKYDHQLTEKKSQSHTSTMPVQPVVEVFRRSGPVEIVREINPGKSISGWDQLFRLWFDRF